LHEPHIGLKKKPRTYRNQARKAYLSVAKQRKSRGKATRKAIRKQLSYVQRNLKTIEKQMVDTPLTVWSHRQYRRLMVVQELCRQQWEMYQQKQHRIEDRIVNIDQPHVPPIVRGKAGAQVEFGAKIAASLIDGYVRIENMQWDNFNEAKTLQASVESFIQRFGYYPEAVLADKLYRNRENRRYCQERGIRLSGPKLGRPPKEGRKADQKQKRQDAAERKHSGAACKHQ
jgi:IS5 family transposase